MIAKNIESNYDQNGMFFFDRASISISPSVAHIRLRILSGFKINYFIRN